MKVSGRFVATFSLKNPQQLVGWSVPFEKGGMKVSAELLARGFSHRGELEHASFPVEVGRVCGGYGAADSPVLSAFHHRGYSGLLGRVCVGVIGEEGGCGVTGGFQFWLHHIGPLWQREGVRCGVEI